MTRKRIVWILTLVGALVVAIVLRHRLIAWFSGARMDDGAPAQVTHATAGAFAITAALRPDPAREQDNTLLVRVLDRAAKPVDGATLGVTYVMPAMGSMPEMRGTATVAGHGDGRYEARFDLPMRGSWTLEVRASSGDTAGVARFQLTIGTTGLVALGDGGGGAAPAEVTEPPLPAFALPDLALAALRSAFVATERVRVELAADRLDGVAAPAREVAQALRAAKAASPGALGDIADCVRDAVTVAEQLASAGDLVAARRAFGELNRFLIALGGADPRLQEGWHVFRCPMVEGFKKWFQRPSELANPYMGQAMPTCGSSSTTWGVAPADDDVAISHEGHGHAGSDTAFYTCAMHPSVREKQDGRCPICSMDLSGVTYDEEESGVIFVDEARRTQIGVRTTKVEAAPMSRSIRAVGRVAYDETRLEDVTVKLGGFITKLEVSETGQFVKKGQVLFTLYSPELFAAQQEYLLAREDGHSGNDLTSRRGEYLLRAAEKKLELWGISRAQIESIAKRGKPLEDVPFTSPASGYVIEKKVVEGAAIAAGEQLFRIAALDRVWVEAEVYEADLALIQKGQRARVELSYLPGKTYEGKVSYVFPYLDPASRTGKIRIELPNDKLELKPDMYATVAFQIDLGPRLQLPIGAVVYTGPRRLVFVDVGKGRLRPQEVTLGVRNEDTVEILGGLRAGQTVVTSGNFLIAAESRIRSSAKFWTEERAAPASSGSGGSQDRGVR